MFMVWFSARLQHELRTVVVAWLVLIVSDVRAREDFQQVQK